MAAGNGAQRRQHMILVVEDDPEINRLVGAYVEFAGFQSLSALDGTEALAHAASHRLSAIILDLMLPDLSGWELCRRFKKDPATTDVPIIMLTALDSEETRAEGLRCGAAEYLTKPFNPNEFLEAVTRHAGQVMVKGN